MNRITNQKIFSLPTQYQHAAALVAGVAMISMLGCVTPWTNRTRRPLPPSSSSVPTPHSTNADAPAVPERAPLSAIDDATEPDAVVQPDTVVQPDAVVPPDDVIVRGQSHDEVSTADADYPRDAMPVTNAGTSAVRPAQYEQIPGLEAGPPLGSGAVAQPGYAAPWGQPASPVPGPNPTYGASGGVGIGPTYGPSSDVYPPNGVLTPLPGDYADLVVNLNETQTGRFMFGVGVNSDLGLTAQAIIDERNFDWRRWPRSLDEIINGTAWRGGGQSLRIEAVPGTEVQRYLINYTQPFLFDTPISFNVSGYLYDRRYFDWDEQRLGGRIGFGYRITPDLSLGVALRGEQVDFHDPRVRGIPIIERALGESDIYSAKATLTHDTRDLPFAPTQGHYLELSYEQALGSFDFPRGNVDYRRYFLLRQRADGSGRHTLGFSFRGGITGSQTPVYENFFAGGYSTMRGFRFRHASPKLFGVIVGGQLSLLGSAEYIFPVTADDMLKGALFCDYGTIEETYNNIDMEDFRVAVGAGLRINVPAMGPAPIAIDFAIPLTREDTDRIQNFSFFVGLGR